MWGGDGVNGQKGDRDGVVFCVVNMHSYTTDVTPEDLRESTREMAIALLACGIDPEKCILYAQSEVAEHAELAWILGCRTTMGALNRMTQYKASSSRPSSPSSSPPSIIAPLPPLRNRQLMA